jgi:hypothetical protein
MHAEKKHMKVEKTSIISEAGKALTGIARRPRDWQITRTVSKGGAVATSY